MFPDCWRRSEDIEKQMIGRFRPLDLRMLQTRNGPMIIKNTLSSLLAAMGMTFVVNGEVLLSEDFESPNVSTTSALQFGATFKKGALPDNGRWVGSTQGFGADRKGLIHKTFGDYTAPTGNNQGFYFGYTNSGITSSVASISHQLQTGMVYSLSFDVARDNNKVESSYVMELLAFAPEENDSTRNDVRSGSKPGVVLAAVSGVVVHG